MESVCNVSLAGNWKTRVAWFNLWELLILTAKSSKITAAWSVREVFTSTPDMSVFRSTPSAKPSIIRLNSAPNATLGSVCPTTPASTMQPNHLTTSTAKLSTPTVSVRNARRATTSKPECASRWIPTANNLTITKLFVLLASVDTPWKTVNVQEPTLQEPLWRTVLVSYRECAWSAWREPTTTSTTTASWWVTSVKNSTLSAGTVPLATLATLWTPTPESVSPQKQPPAKIPILRLSCAQNAWKDITLISTLNANK